MLMVVGLIGCSPARNGQAFLDPPESVCIVKHEAVRHPLFLEGMVKGFESNGASVRVVDGTYRKNTSESKWIADFTQKDANYTCNEFIYYVANWQWDIVMYLQYANIWTSSGKFASYQMTALSGYNVSQKFTGADVRAIEMVNDLYEK